MKPAKKQITAFGLLLIVVLPIFLSVGLYIKQLGLQNQRKQRFDTELMQTITVAAEKLVWVKAEKEILINNKLFDVNFFEKIGTNIVLTGFYDHKEDKLVKHIKDFNEQKNDTSSPINQLTVKFLFYPKYNEVNSFSLQNNSWQIITRQFPVYTENLTELTYPVPAQPPKYC